ncbi:MAG TPA: aminotransferase class I/II-fold pyridoxal phosphate-dependent enzyme [Acidobacteriaceae bacterium]|jgi:histidinol-phosphate aminotransferase
MSTAFKSGLSRRSFLYSLGAASVAATSLPGYAAVQGMASHPTHGVGSGNSPNPVLSIEDDIIFISMNENPLGPPQSALNAISGMAAVGNRYHGDVIQTTVSTALDLFGMNRGYVGLFPGTAGPLHLALMSHIGPGRPLVYADPGYEQGAAVADVVGAQKFAVKLTSTYAHDVKAMVAATPKAGAYYIVNPNNPTGTMTPKEDIVWLLKHKPAGSVVIVDEAYHEFSNADSCIDLVAADHDIIVTRTFSKIYGMAGIRAGLVFARPEYFQKFRAIAPYAPTLASVSITSAAAANAALLDEDLVPLRRKINADVRSETLEFLAKHGHSVVPGSQANFFMVDVKRPGGEFQSAMLGENVAVGRTWASMPTHVRVSVGSRSEMAKFQAAFVKCIDQPSTAVNGAASLHVPALNPSELNRPGWMFA